MNKISALLAASIAAILAGPCHAADATPQSSSGGEAPATVAVPPDPASESTAANAATAAEEESQALRFETPDAAAMALIEAADDEGGEGLYAVLGPDLEDLLSGDPVADAADRRWFVERAREGAEIEGEDEESAILVLGAEEWPFPIPLAKDASGWYFDVEAGREELLDRRIGRNELHTIASLRAFVEAEREYAAADPDGDGVQAYASRILSSEGKRDGLYWPTAAGDSESPLGPLVAEAVAEGYSSTQAEGPRPFHGYYFKLLKGQGESAPGGAKSYEKDGRLSEGFGMLAWPASYGSSGIMTFQVNQKGMVYQSDLGEETAERVSTIDTYNPGEGWEAAVD
jgi:hypothetical protein